MAYEERPPPREAFRAKRSRKARNIGYACAILLLLEIAITHSYVRWVLHRIDTYYFTGIAFLPDMVLDVWCVVFAVATAITANFEDRTWKWSVRIAFFPIGGISGYIVGKLLIYRSPPTDQWATALLYTSWARVLTSVTAVVLTFIKANAVGPIPTAAIPSRRAAPKRESGAGNSPV